MIRFLLRILGFVLLAAAFVGAVVDGARSIANDAVSLTPLGDVAAAVLKERYLALRPAAESLHPLVWQGLLGPLASVPAVLAALLVGALLLRLGQVPAEPFGALVRR